MTTTTMQTYVVKCSRKSHENQVKALKWKGSERKKYSQPV